MTAIGMTRAQVGAVLLAKHTDAMMAERRANKMVTLGASAYRTTLARAVEDGFALEIAYEVVTGKSMFTNPNATLADEPPRLKAVQEASSLPPESA